MIIIPTIARRPGRCRTLRISSRANVVREVPILARDPVVAYLPDRFTRPNPLRPDVLIDIGRQLDRVTGDARLPTRRKFSSGCPYNRGQLEPGCPGRRRRSGANGSAAG